MKYPVYQQNICSNCLQWLANNESDHSKEEKQTMFETLEQWSKENYVQAGLANNEDSFFSHAKCDLCNCLPGTRYEYNFFDKTK